MSRLGRILLAIAAVVALALVVVAYLGAGRRQSLKPAIRKLTWIIGNARKSTAEIDHRAGDRQAAIDDLAAADRIARRRAEGLRAARLRADREARRHEAERILRGEG